LPKKQEKPVLSPNGVYKVLKRLNLETEGKRQRFSKFYQSQKPVANQFTPEDRLYLIEKVIKQGLSVKEACRQMGVSRFTYYKWYKRYIKASPGQEADSLKNKKRAIDRYWRQATPEQEKAVINIVVKNPQLGKYNILKQLPRIAGKPILGNHGIYNVLKRNSLNTYDMRLAYAKSHQPVIKPLISTAWVDRLKQVFQKFIPTIAPANKYFRNLFPLLLQQGRPCPLNHLLILAIKLNNLPKQFFYPPLLPLSSPQPF
jgi:transposase-like protein